MKTRSLDTARHEAAHAVATLVVGGKVNNVRLTRGDRGYCDSVYPTNSRKMVDPMAVAIASLAGHAADLLWKRGTKITRVPAHDHLVVTRFGFTGRSLPTLLMLAQGLVHEHEEAIERVAAALVEGDLGGKQVRMLFRGTR